MTHRRCSKRHGRGLLSRPRRNVPIVATPSAAAAVSAMFLPIASRWAEVCFWRAKPARVRPYLESRHGHPPSRSGGFPVSLSSSHAAPPNYDRERARDMSDRRAACVSPRNTQRPSRARRSGATKTGTGLPQGHKRAGHPSLGLGRAPSSIAEGQRSLSFATPSASSSGHPSVGKGRSWCTAKRRARGDLDHRVHILDRHHASVRDAGGEATSRDEHRTCLGG